MRNSRLISGFRHVYSQEFLNQLAKDLGIKWTKVEFRTIPHEDVPVCPMPPPSGILLYSEVKYKKDDDREGL